MQIRLSGEPLEAGDNLCFSFPTVSVNLETEIHMEFSLSHTHTYLSTTSNHITRTIGGLDYDCK